MFGERWIEKWFAWKISVRRIEKHFLKSSRPQPSWSWKEQAEPRVAAVQRQIRLVRNIGEYIDNLRGFVDQAAKENCFLTVFPEYNFFDLLGLIPGFHWANRLLNRKAKQPAAGKGAGEGDLYPVIRALFSAIANPLEKAIRAIISHTAKEFGMYIYSGSIAMKEKGNIVNAGFLFGPDGACLGMQKKIHLTGFEERIGMGRGREMEICSLPFGNVAFPICMDATYFETFCIARELKADLVLLPIANMEEYDPWKSLRGIWPRVQESFVYGIQSSLNGWIAGMHFTGKAGIYAPIPMTPEKDGVVAESVHFEGDGVVTAAVHPAQLRHTRENDQYHGDVNSLFEAGYLEKTYFSNLRYS